jgi:hypothetical protein
VRSEPLPLLTSGDLKEGFVKVSFRSRLTILALVLAACSALAMATPTVTLGIYTQSTSWRLYAAVSNDCAGLDSFAISFGGGGSTQILSSTLKAPKGYDATLEEMFGFKNLTSNGIVSAGAVSEITAAQGVIYGDVNDPSKDALVLQGIGQQAGSWVDGSGNTVATWGWPVLLAQGTFSGPAQFVTGVLDIHVLIGTNGTWTGPGNVLVDTIHVKQVGANGLLPAEIGGYWIEGTPEPGTLILLGAGGLALIRRRR